MKLPIGYLLFVSLFFSGCVIIQPGEVAINVRYGKVLPQVLTPGYHAIPVFGSNVVRFSTRIINYSQKIDFPTKDGIEVTCEISLLYHFVTDSIKDIYNRFGMDAEANLIVNGLTNSIRQLGVNYTASDIIDVRAELETALRKKLVALYQPYGFVVDIVMLKDIDLPPDIVQTIKDKVNAEQRYLRTMIENDIKNKELEFSIGKQNKELDFNLAMQKKEMQVDIDKQRMAADFSIEKQQKEATRMMIEANSTRRSQQAISRSLTDKFIRYKSLEISKEWAHSNNTKLIITDGKQHFWMNELK